MIKEDMAKAGIVMNITFIEWSVYTQRLENKSFEVCTLGWGMGLEDDPYQIWHSSQADKGSNFVGFRNEEADGLIETARKEFDPQQRRLLFNRFSEILHEEQPYTFLFTTDALVAVARRFHNVTVHPMGLTPRQWWVPKDAQKYRGP